MRKIKVGDKIQRILGIHMNMKVGDVATVLSVRLNSITLQEFGGHHDVRNFKLAFLTWKEKYARKNEI